MTLYERAKKNIVRRYTCQDGFGNSFAEFGLALIDGTAIEVFSFGCMNARMRPWDFKFSSVEEMIAAADSCPLYEPVKE